MGTYKYLLVMIITLLVASGCTKRLTDFTLISTKNIDLSRGAEFTRHETRVLGEDTVFIFLLFPIGLPNMKQATDNAIESTPGAIALLDGVVESEGFWFIMGYSKYKVKGTPLIDPKLLKK